MSHLLHRLSDLNRKIAKLRRKNASSKLHKNRDLIYIVSVGKSYMPAKYQKALKPLFDLDPEGFSNLDEKKAKEYIDLYKELEKVLGS